MPVYNERAHIETILQRVQAVDIDKEIIIVDDGSTDGTQELLAQLAETARCTPPVMMLPGAGAELRTDNIRVFFHGGNVGKGAALRRGFLEARGEILVVQDADLEYDPKDYYRLLEPIVRGTADVVYGSRVSGAPPGLVFFVYRLGNQLSTGLSNLLTHLNLSDIWSGYKVFKRGVLEKIQLRENRFGFELEVTARVAKLGCRVCQVPVSYRGRTYAEGKKITWTDGLNGLWCILRYNVFG